MRKVVLEVISLLFVVLFVYTAAAKLIEYQKFKVTIGQSPLLTDISGFIAIFIPLIEIVVSIMLVVPRWRTAGLYSSFTLMVIFTAYIVAILNFSEHIPCSCGGVIGEMGWSAHLIFNIVFVVLALVAIALDGRSRFNGNSSMLSTKILSR